MTYPNSIAGTGVVVSEGPGKVLACVLVAGDAEDASLILYDNTVAASGTVLLRLKAKAGDSAAIHDMSIPFSLGVYAVLTGAGASAICYT